MTGLYVDSNTLLNADNWDFFLASLKEYAGRGYHNKFFGTKLSIFLKEEYNLVIPI
jgi:hypothetical protein